MAIQFDRRISIDGVAVILAAIFAVMWFTRLESKVENTARDVASHDARLDKLTDSTVLLQQSVAVLTALQYKQKPTP